MDPVRAGIGVNVGGRKVFVVVTVGVEVNVDVPVGISVGVLVKVTSGSTVDNPDKAV